MGRSRTKRRNQIRRNILKERKHQEKPPPTEQEDEEPVPAPAPVTVATIFRNEELTELCRVWNVNDVSEEPPLVAAVALNKVALVKRLIGEGGIDLESRGPGGRTALLEAVRTRSLELVDLLAAHGADASAVDAEGSTAPLLALGDEWWTQEAMLALCGLLPKLDVDRVADVGKGYTLLHHAVRRGWDMLLEALLDRRAQVDCATPRGITPLMLAGCTRRWQPAQRLLLAGARLRQEDVHGCTPLCYACATLLVKGRNRETVELMLRRLAVPLDDYVLRRLHLLRHPPRPPAEFAAAVSSIVAQALYCVARHVRNGLRALLDAHVFAHVARTLDAHRACAEYAHALLGLLFVLARHCECCTQVAGVDAAWLADAFVGGGAPDACLAVMIEHCVADASTTLPDRLMRLLVAALLPLAVVFGRSPDAGASWLERRGADLAPFYAVFRRATHISVSARIDVVHLRLVRRQLRSFHKLYAGAATSRAQPQSLRAVLSTEAQPEGRSVTSMDSVDSSAEKVAAATRDGCDSKKSVVPLTKVSLSLKKASFKDDAFKDSVVSMTKTSCKGVASKESVVPLTETSFEDVDSNESVVSMATVASSESVAAKASSSFVGSAVGSAAQEEEDEYERLQGEWQEVVKRGSKTALRNKSKSQTCFVGKHGTKAKTGPTALDRCDVATTRSEPSLEKIGGRPSPGKPKNPDGRRMCVVGKGASDGQENKPHDHAATRVNHGGPADRTSTAPDPKKLRAAPRAAKDGGRRVRRIACAPTATSTPKTSASASTSARSERVRRKDAEVVADYHRLPRALHFGADSLGPTPDNDVVQATPSDTDLGVDSGLGASLEPCDATPLIVIYDPQASSQAGDDLGEDEAEAEAERPTDPSRSRREPGGCDDPLKSVARPRARLSEVDLDIRNMLSSLELSMLGLSASHEDFGKRLASKKSRCNRIEVRLSERRLLTVVDDLFTALVDALSTRWRAAQASCNGKRVLLSAFRDLAQSQLRRARSPLERERLARHVRRWRALPRKARACDEYLGTEQARRVTALLMSHLSALARRPVGPLFKRRASALDTVLSKRARVGGAPTRVRKGRAVRRRVLRTLGTHAHNLKVIEPSGGDVDAVATPSTGGCTQHHHQPHRPTKPPVAPPPGFGPQHLAAVRSSDLHSTVVAAEFRPQRRDFLYAHDAVNVQSPPPALAFGVGVDECASSDDFASVRGVVDHLRLDDDADFEEFLQRKALADKGAVSGGGGAGALAKKKENPMYQFKKWVPLRQPPRASLVQDVAALRTLRHDNLVVWEAVTVSAAGLRIAAERMQCNLAQLVERAGADMTATRVLALCLQMARGLRFLHSQLLVHGGLKPSNVLVDDWGVARLADFGLYRLKPPTAVPCLWWSTETRAQFARTCQLVCSPESDAQALGMLFHFAATGGQHPFVGTHAHDKPAALGCASYELRQLTHDLLQHESALRPTLRAALRHVCWWDAHERRALVLRCAGWMAEGCAEQSVFIDVALEPLLPRWRTRTADVTMCAASDTPSGLLRMLNSAPQLTDALLRRLPELPLALHRLAAQTPSLRTLLHFSSLSTFDTV